MLVCTLGDLLLDVIVRLDGPLSRGSDTHARTLLAPGGQAANVAAWCSFAGAPARFVGRRADDDAGRLVGAALAAYGVELAGPVSPQGTGVVVSLVSADGERTMASDRGVAPLLAEDDLDASWFAGCSDLFVSGYSLAREPINAAAVRAADLARRAGARLSVDLGASTVIAELGTDEFRSRLERLAPDVVFCNEDEDRALGRRLPGVHWVVKRGPLGCSFDGEERPAVAVDRAVDSTGAGDALAAGYLVEGPELALQLAARCVAKAGSMP